MRWVMPKTRGETFGTSGNTTWEKLSWPTQHARATVLGYRVICHLAAPHSETNQKQQNTLLWPFPCSGIPVPNAMKGSARAAVSGVSEGRLQPHSSREQAPAAGEHKEQPVAESPVQRLSMTGQQETLDKIRNVRLYQKLMATSVL